MIFTDGKICGKILFWSTINHAVGLIDHLGSFTTLMKWAEVGLFMLKLALLHSLAPSSVLVKL